MNKHTDIYKYYDIESYFVNMFNNKFKYEIYGLDDKHTDNHNIDCIHDITDANILIKSLRLIFPNINSNNIYSRIVIVETILFSLNTNTRKNAEYDDFQFELRKMMWICYDFLKKYDRYRNDENNVNNVNNGNVYVDTNNNRYLHSRDSFKYKQD